MEPNQRRRYSTFFQKYTPVKEEVDQEDQSDDTGTQDFDTEIPRIDRLHKRHKLVERYNDIRMPKSQVGHALNEGSKFSTNN